MRTSLGQAYGLTHEDAIVVNLKAENGKIARVLGNYGLHELPKARSLIECFLMGSCGSSLARYPDLLFTWVGDLNNFLSSRPSLFILPLRTQQHNKPFQKHSNILKRVCQEYSVGVSV
jgi:hypothetical protein